MTTQEFLSEIDLEKGLKSLERTTGETMDFESYKSVTFPIELSNLIKKYCDQTYIRGSINGNFSIYNINNGEVLNYLRDLWLESNNSFVKKVIVTVGKERKFTDKQIDVISKEGVKFNIELRFKK